MKKKLNILFICPEFLNDNHSDLVDGGIAHQYFKWASELIKRGNIVTVVVNKKGVNKTKIVFNGITVYEVDFFAYKKKIRLYLFILSLGSLYIKSGLGIFLLIKNFQKRIDIIQICSDCLLNDLPLIKIPHCIRISCDIWEYFKNSSIRISTKLLEKYEQQLGNCKYIFGPSIYIANKIKNKLKINQQIDIIETPVDQNIAKEDECLYKLLSNKKYFLYFGTISKLKGCLNLADVIYKVLDRYKEIYFVLVGKQEKENGNYIVDLIKKNSKEYEDRVIHFDKMTHNLLFPIIRGAEFCVMPSLTENFSNACIEAMSLNKIVIGTSPFFNQIIRNGISGFLCNCNDSDSLYKTICQVLSLSIEKRKEIEINAKKRATECDPQKLTNDLLNYYQRIITEWNQWDKNNY